MTMITPSYLGETIEYSSLHACRSTLEDPTDKDRLLTLLCQDFKHVESLDNYDVYRRPRPAAPLSATAGTMPVAGSPLHR